MRVPVSKSTRGRSRLQYKNIAAWQISQRFDDTRIRGQPRAELQCRWFGDTDLGTQRLN